MTETADLTVRRVRLALETDDVTFHLGAAIAIAARLRATFEGLLLTERELAQLSDATTARYVSRIPGPPEPRPPNIEAELRGLAAMMQSAIELDAARLGLSWSLLTIRDQLTRSITETFDPGDLLIASARSRLLASVASADETIAELMKSVPGPLLILPSGESMPQRALVFAAPQAEVTRRALRAALEIAGIAAQNIEVALPGSERTSGDAQRAIQAWFAEQGRQGRFVSAFRTGITSLVELSTAHDQPLVVLPAGLEGLGRIRVADLRKRARASLLIVH